MEKWSFPNTKLIWNADDLHGHAFEFEKKQKQKNKQIDSEKKKMMAKIKNSL